jgi:hypothetical protein
MYACMSVCKSEARLQNWEAVGRYVCRYVCMHACLFVRVRQDYRIGRL